MADHIWRLLEPVTDKLLVNVSYHIYPSECREFATKRLGIGEPRYEMIKEDALYARQINYRVNVYILEISNFVCYNCYLLLI